MPAALVDIPWDQIRQDRLSGMSYDELADRYGVSANTINQRAYRQGWKSSKEMAEQAARSVLKTAAKAHIAQALPLLKPAMDAAIEEWQNDAKDTAKKIIKQVSGKLDSELEPEDLVKLANALDRGDLVGRRAMGLDKVDAGSTVNLSLSLGIGVLGADGRPTIGLRGDYEPVIEVEQVRDTKDLGRDEM